MTILPAANDVTSTSWSEKVSPFEVVLLLLVLDFERLFVGLSVPPVSLPGLKVTPLLLPFEEEKHPRSAA